MGGWLADIQAPAFSQSVRYDYFSGGYLTWSDRSDGNNTGYYWDYGLLQGIWEQRSQQAVFFTHTNTSHTSSAYSYSKRVNAVAEYGNIGFEVDPVNLWGVISNRISANLGQEMRIEYGNYETRFFTSGKDDVIGNSDDIVQTYQFDNTGKTTCVTSATRDGKEQYGASNAVYGSKDSDKNRVTASAAVSKTALNLLTDSSFERGKNEWRVIDDESGASCSRTTAAAMYGWYSQKVTVSATNSGMDGYTQTISGLTPGKHYVLSGYVKANNVTGKGACLQFTDYGRTSQWTRYTSNYETGTTPAEVNGGWRRVWVDFEIPTDAIGFTVNLGVMQGKGTAYFDGIQLAIIF